MKSTNIELKFNKNEKIIIKSEVPLENINYYSDASFFLISNAEKTIFFKDSLKYGIEILHIMLNKALNNDLQLHNSIKQDIGYLYNEEIQNKEGLFYEQLEGRKFWVGRNYHLWGYNHLTTWLYNSSNADIILEVTPIYPGSFSDQKKAAQKISYNDWLINYKPYLLKILSKNTAQQWLEQTQNILNQIKYNTALELKNQL